MISDEEREVVKRNFSGWLETQDAKAELTREAGALIDTTASLLQVKKPIVSAMFRYLKKKHDSATDELGEINDTIEEVFGQAGVDDE